MTKGKSLGWIFSENRVVVLDYDDMSLEEVKEDVGQLQEKFKLGNGVISKSSEQSYHVFFFSDPFNFDEFEAILKESRCDKDFEEFVGRIEKGRIRVGEKDGSKPEVVGKVESNYSSPTDKGKFLERMYREVVT